MRLMDLEAAQISSSATLEISPTCFIRYKGDRFVRYSNSGCTAKVRESTFGMRQVCELAHRSILFTYDPNFLYVPTQVAFSYLAEVAGDVPELWDMVKNNIEELAYFFGRCKMDFECAAFDNAIMNINNWPHSSDSERPGPNVEVKLKNGGSVLLHFSSGAVIVEYTLGATGMCRKLITGFRTWIHVQDKEFTFDEYRYIMWHRLAVDLLAHIGVYCVEDGFCSREDGMFCAATSASECKKVSNLLALTKVLKSCLLVRSGL